MPSSDIREKMKNGEIYDPSDKQLAREQLACLKQLQKFNGTRSTPRGCLKRCRLLKQMFAELGEDCYIEPPLRASWGGRNVHFGSHVYCNYNVMLVDDADIYVGSHTMIGPNVAIVTASHPVLPELRERGLEFNLPVRIGENCWIGAGAIILPGVSVGDESVIGAGSVVTKDVPPGVVAFGNPCRVQRSIDEHDREFYNTDRRIPAALLRDPSL